MSQRLCVWSLPSVMVSVVYDVHLELKQGLCVWSPLSVVVSVVCDVHLEARIVCVKSAFCLGVYSVWCPPWTEGRIVCVKSTFCLGVCSVWCPPWSKDCVWSPPFVLVSSVWSPPWTSWSKECVCEVHFLSWWLVYEVHIETMIVCVKSAFCLGVYYVWGPPWSKDSVCEVRFLSWCLGCMRSTLKQGLCVWSLPSVLMSSMYEVHIETKIVCVKSAFCLAVYSVWCPPWTEGRIVCEVRLLSGVYSVWCPPWTEARIVCVKSTFCLGV